MTRAAIRELIDLLAEPAKRETWQRAYQGLQDFGVRAVPELMEALTHEKGGVRQSVAWLLAELGPAAACACPALRDALTDPRARVRRAVVEALRRIGAGARAALPGLLARLTTDPDDEVRVLAAQALAALGSARPQILAGLVQVIDDPHVPLRAAAAEALGQFAALDSVGQLLEEQFIIDDDARPELGTSLARVAPERLVKLVMNDPDLFLPLDREVVGSRTFGRTCKLIMRLAALGPGAAPVQQVFVQMLGTPARRAALYGLGRVGAAARDTIPTIARPLDKPARAALRAISLASWLEADQQARARRKHWRQSMREHFRERWQGRPLDAASQQTIEELVCWGSRGQILAARLKAGDLARERVELAALLGDRPSLQVLGGLCPKAEMDALDRKVFQQWAETLVSQPIEARARIGQAVARDVLSLWQDEYLEDDCVQDAVHALEDWICTPGQEQWEDLRRALEFHIRQFSTPPSLHAGWAIVAAARPDQQREVSSALLGAYHAWRATPGVALGWFFGKPRSFEPLPEDQTIARIRRVVRASVVPWALDEGDPIREPLLRLFECYPRMRDKG